MIVTFYNSSGTPIAYIQDGKHIYLYSGEPVAYIYEQSVYSYSGVHLGRYTNGWIRDNGGYCVFFTTEAKGGPMKPMKRMKPMKGMKGMKPMKGMKKIRPIKPSNKSGWSTLSSKSFFFQ